MKLDFPLFQRISAWLLIPAGIITIIQSLLGTYTVISAVNKVPLEDSIYAAIFMLTYAVTGIFLIILGLKQARDKTHNKTFLSILGVALGIGLLITLILSLPSILYVIAYMFADYSKI